MVTDNENFKTLEHEFYEHVELHKCVVIEACLIALEKEEIYNSALLRSHYSDMEESGNDRAERVLNDIIDRTNAGEDELFDLVYEMCWERVRDRINDRKAYHLECES